MELAYRPGKNKDEHTAAFLYKFNKWKYDFLFLGGMYQTDYVVGSGWAGNIKEAGFKGEMSYFIPKKIVWTHRKPLAFLSGLTKLSRTIGTFRLPVYTTAIRRIFLQPTEVFTTLICPQNRCSRFAIIFTQL
ncbi:hypothetical protein [Flavobacterium sp. ZS1P14]|uniref:hypothetical protein n=1 Tax=Flavobacterium sp. ZS1P14 TaxID=3401729 RepID=UPI003AABD62E